VRSSVITNALSPSLETQKALSSTDVLVILIIVQQNRNYNKRELRVERGLGVKKGTVMRSRTSHYGLRRETPLCREALYLDLVTRWAPYYIL
jgi:hypothetical protein